MRQAWQQLRDLVQTLRWRGPLRFLLLAARELLSPFMYWYIFRVFETDLRLRLPEPYTQGEFRVLIYTGRDDLEKHKRDLVSMGELSTSEIESRLQRGDAVAVAYDGLSPVGYMWVNFTGGMELALETAWIINPDEALRYGSFVRPEWRGRRLHSDLNHAVNTYARDRGLIRMLASISVLNKQSMSLAVHYRKEPAMTLTLIRIRGLNWTYRKSFGAPLENHCLVSTPFRKSRADVF